ncbi:uncharacterized protein LACBIDRAFT_332931 [Laccaria bicolor S238N-H82]|uniref:Predicted protein n=1 Tax=Laccaria bicolor (strain S238N-H82 / ATCC MYA-4686) TaxID=486041 RepID=B0DUB1_LACBS|nr:uncharacterized protein LACBIDRAFT_332931 [Laccaria bicolor S238N-H82]EDR01713.1 predicted protein [Laccaria bicolor S238N-H82]|eukprot:XP_001887526.1 predicted protein [Laccaria bicolor S238N-H82]
MRFRWPLCNPAAATSSLTWTFKLSSPQRITTSFRCSPFRATAHAYTIIASSDITLSALQSRRAIHSRLQLRYRHGHISYCVGGLEPKRSKVAASLAWQRPYDGDFFFERGVTLGGLMRLFQLTSVLRDHQLIFSQAQYTRRVPFHSQNNQSPRHTCPKASWVLVLPGCGKSHLHGGVSGIISPDVAPLTTVKRRLVVSAFELGTQHGGAFTLGVNLRDLSSCFQYTCFFVP